jgi:long-chain fatty acid transport protein
VKSPQWFETFRFQAADELGRPRTLKFRFDYPLMVSAGAAYTGFDRWTLAADVRFIDYHNTKGFSRTGFDPSGAVRGLGWDSIFVLALGAQYRPTDPLSLRVGYSFNTNPVDDEVASFNVASPVVVQHAVYAGASYQVTHAFLVSAAYAHAFQNSVRGPIVGPLGPVPGSSVESSLAGDTFMFGATVKY